MGSGLERTKLECKVKKKSNQKERKTFKDRGLNIIIYIIFVITHAMLEEKC